MTADILSYVSQAALGASIAIAFVLLVRGWLREQFGSHIAYAFWLLVPAAMFASILPAELVFSGEVPVNETIAAQPVDNSSAPAAQARPDTTAVNTSPALPAQATEQARADTLPATTSILLIIWFAGFAFSLGALLLKQYRFLKTRQLLDNSARIQTIEGNNFGPAVVGVIKPRIILPHNFTDQYNKLERALILAHEKAHIRSGDIRMNALAAFLKCLNWFNPLVYIALKQFRIDQELACDERVMRRHGSYRHVYAKTLLKSQLLGEQAPIGCGWLPQALHPLKSRVAHLATPPMSATRRSAGVVALLAAVTFSSASAWGMFATHIVHVEQTVEAQEKDEGPTDLEGAQGFALAYSIAEGQRNYARALIKAGADVNLSIPGDGTPLMLAIRARDRGMVDLLLEAGADVDKAVSGDGSPLILAARYNDEDVVKLLLEAGANPNKASGGDGNPLIAAARRGNEKIVELLLEAGADANGFVLGDETPLIGAARAGNLDVARTLVAAGADVNLKVETGNKGLRRAKYRSPLGQALHHKHDRMADFLRSEGATEPTSRED